MPVFRIGEKRYDYSWPDNPKVHQEDRIVFKMRKLTIDEKREIQDGQLTLISNKKVNTNSPEVGDFNYHINTGTTNLIMLRAVVGWDNVVDESNNKISFSQEALDEVITQNGGQPSESDNGEVYSLASDLIEHIQEKNFSRRERPTPQKT